MYLSETYEKKWQPVLEHSDLPKITDSYRRAVTATILENQERAQKEDQAFLSEAAPTNATKESCSLSNLQKENPPGYKLIQESFV